MKIDHSASGGSDSRQSADGDRPVVCLETSTTPDELPCELLVDEVEDKDEDEDEDEDEEWSVSAWPATLQSLSHCGCDAKGFATIKGG